MKVDLIKGMLSWINDGETIKIDNADLIQKRYYPMCEMIVALIGKDPNAPDYIVGYLRNGKLVFKSTPPKGFTFAYLCEHLKAEIAVVCGVDSGESNSNTWRDYFFGLNKKMGTCPS